VDRSRQLRAILVYGFNSLTGLKYKAGKQDPTAPDAETLLNLFNLKVKTMKHTSKRKH